MNSQVIENYLQALVQLRKEIRLQKKPDSHISAKSNSALSLYNIKNQQQLEDRQNVDGNDQNNNIIQVGDQNDSNITNVDKISYFEMLSQAEKYLKLVLNNGYNLQPLALEKILKEYETIPFKEIQSISESEIYKVFSFNSDNTLLATSQRKNIKIFNILNFMKREFQEYAMLQAHKDEVTSLVFSKKKNYLLSGGADNCIYLWKDLHEQNQWQVKISVNTNSPISCMILNKQENFIIVGNKYGFLQIWSLNFEKKEIKIAHEMRKIHEKIIYGISLNSSQNRIITCSQDEKLVLWSINERGLLSIISETERDSYVTRILFLDDKRILLAQNKQGLIQLKLENDKFEKNEQIIIEDHSEDHYYFPIQYHQIRNIIIIKYNRFIYVLRNFNKDVYEQQKKLESKSMNIYGTLSTDSKHLVIYNEQLLKVYELFE